MYYICLLIVPLLCVAVSCLFGVALDLHFGIIDEFDISNINILVYGITGFSWGVAFVVTGKLAGEQFASEGMPSLQHKPYPYFKMPLFNLYRFYFGRGISLVYYLKGLWVAWPLNLIVGWLLALKTSEYLSPNVKIESINMFLLLFGIWALSGLLWFLFVLNRNRFFP